MSVVREVRARLAQDLRGGKGADLPALAGTGRLGRLRQNNLEVISSLLELQSNSSNDLQAKSALEAGQIRVQSIALIHHKLYHSESLAKIAFKEFIEDLYSQICKIFQREDANIMFKVYGDDLILEMDVAVPIGLILNELMTNSFKYAVKKGAQNTITIQLVPIPDQSSW